MKKTMVVIALALALAAVTLTYGSYFPSITINESQLDGFSRLSVANPVTLFDSQFQYDLQPLVWQTNLANAASISNLFNECAVAMTTATNNNSRAILQTYQYFKYQPGKAQQIFTTFVLGTAQSNVIRRVGYFDANDGIFLEQNGTNNVAMVRRTSVSGTVVDNRDIQTNWNKDKFDGSGVSGVTLNLAAAQILVIDLQFLGVGRVRTGFDINGSVCWANEFLNANNLSNVYMRTANLPLRYEQTATTNAPQTTMKAICSSVISDGGFESDRGIPFSVANTADLTLSATATNCISIRPKLTYGGLVNRVQIVPSNFELLGGANPIYYEIYYGGTVSGGTWTSADTNSVVEFSVNSSVPVGGIRIDNGFVASNAGGNRSPQIGSFTSRLPITLDINGTNPIPVSIVVRSTTGTPTVRGSISWSELR